MLSAAQLQAALLQGESVLPTGAGALAVLALTLLATHLVLPKRDAKLKSSSYDSLPRPASTLPILGNTLDAIYTQKDRLYDWMAEQHELHQRPWLLSVIGYPPTMVVSTPELFEDVLKTHFDAFPKADSQCDIFRDVFGFGIIAVNGSEWHAQRKATGQLFTPQRIKDTMYPIMQLKAQTLCNMLSTYETRGAPISLKRVLNHFTTDVFAKTGFGVELHCLENGVESDRENEFAYATRVASQVMQQRFQEPLWLWRLKRSLNIGQEKVLRENIGYIDSLVYSILDSAMERKSLTNDPSEPTDESEKDLISTFLENSLASGEDGDGPDAKAIRDSVVNFFIGGTETSAQSMAFLVVMLNRYPRVLAKIREEVRTKFPGLATGKAELPSMEELGQLVYLEAAIRENLRLNPTGPVTMRQAIDDVMLSDGTFVAKGTRVILAFYASMRATSVWGDDALEFKPERWIDATTGALIAESPFKFPAFLAGPRICLGMRFAVTEMKLNMALLLSRFDVTTVQNPWELTYEVAIACGVKGPLMVNVAKATGAQQ
ncbi:Cytochrome p450 [Globisporangium polare]